MPLEWLNTTHASPFSFCLANMENSHGTQARVKSLLNCRLAVDQFAVFFFGGRRVHRQASGGRWLFHCYAIDQRTRRTTEFVHLPSRLIPRPSRKRR